MNAEEARQISREAIKGPAILRFIEELDKHIVAAARKGKVSINDIAKFSTPGPTRRERESLAKHFRAKGFLWIDYPDDYPDPDPDHPASCSYTEISWG